MGLLTGEPRSATVIAREETQVLQIGKFSLKPILDNNPGLIKELSRTIEERRELLSQKENIHQTEADEEDKNVLRSIKKFFGLN
jgi:CRP-like cAMP-binding protein